MSISAERPRAKPRRIERAEVLLRKLTDGPRIDALTFLDQTQMQIVRRLFRDWITPLRSELIDLQHELCMKHRVLRDCLAHAEPPTDQPFLTPGEFAEYVRPFHTCICEVTTIRGDRIEGFLYWYGGDQIGINGRLLCSCDVADMDCIDRRIEWPKRN